MAVTPATPRTITVEALAAAVAHYHGGSKERPSRADKQEASGIFAALPAEPAGATGLREALGVAIHEAKQVGGPWSPCPWPYDYNTGSYECECRAMGYDLAARAALAATTPVGEGE